MSAPVVRALVALGVVGASLFFALSTPAKLGLDLRGGTQIVLETRDSPTVKANKESTDRALEVLRRRVDALGVAEPSITRSGDRRIIVELPGLQDPREAAKVIGRTAALTFHPVLASAEPQSTPSGDPSASPSNPAAGSEGRLIDDEDGQPIRIGPATLTGEGVKNAAAEVDPQGLGQWSVSIAFAGSGDDKWAKLTGDAACAVPDDPKRRVAIVLDDQVISSPGVQQDVACDVGIVGGSTQIVGSFTAEEAKDLAALIKGGALPVPVDVIEQRTVGPTLGKAAIDASATAAVIGVALTGLFIIVVYRLVGALATVALAAYALLSYAALVALGATLTLPGLASSSPSGWRSTRTCWSSNGRGRSTPRRPASRCGRLLPPASRRPGRRSSTRTSRRCSRPGSCSSSPQAPSGASASRCRSVYSPPWSPPW